MGQISMEIVPPNGSLLSGNQQSSPKLSRSFDNDLMRRPKARGHHSVPSANSTNSSRRTPMSRVPRGPALAGDGTLSSRSSQSIIRSEIECSPVHDDKPLHRKGSFLFGQKGAGHSGCYLWPANIGERFGGRPRSRYHPSNTSGFAANHFRSQLSAGTSGKPVPLM